MARKKKLKGWKGKLTKAELQHVKETTVNCTLKEFIENRHAQKTMATKSTPEVCWECRMIAKKLGLED